MDSDLLSLEQADVFADLYVHADVSPLHSLSCALHKLQLLFGVVPHVKTKGDYAKQVLAMLM
ncbi:hypothetical protein EON64_17315, partial [archaeon]